MQRSCFPFKHQHFDLLVCGGGIYGAWTAYDAALRGLKVIIVEQNDWASGSSSASSKLIHGGLRYLETLDFGVVKKSLLARHQLLKAAPYRVWPLRFGIPINQHSRIGACRLKVGLSIYDFLAGINYSQQTHSHFNASSFFQRFPCLDNSNLKGGYTYFDAQTDDSRLVIELIDGACAAGASCLNYCQLSEVLAKDGVVSGAVLRDKISNEQWVINTAVIVNTIGQWIATAHPEKQWCRLSKGVHLILPKMLENEALLLTAKSDGRVFFVIPWYGQTLLGTTDTDFNPYVDQLTVEQADIDYLLSEANIALTTKWTEKDIQGQYAGLRVLQYSPKKLPSQLTRQWQLKAEKKGLFYSIGGKLTSSHEDAMQIVDTVCQYLNKTISCQTMTKPFPWMPEKNYHDWLVLMTKKASHLDIDKESTQWLLRRHGKQVAEIFQQIERQPYLAKRITPTVPLIVADLMFCLKFEMVFHLEDLLRRRIPLLILYRMTKTELAQFAEICAKTLNWDQLTTAKEIKNCAEKWLEK